jgi:hypothetical protein
MPFIEKLLALFPSLSRLSFTVGFVCLVFYGLAWVIDLDSFGQLLGLADLRTWAGLGAVVSFAIFGADRVYAFGAWRFSEWQANQKAKKEREIKKAYLHGLTHHERERLKRYIDEESQSVDFLSIDSYMLGLEHKGIVYMIDTNSNVCFFNIEPWAYEYLLDHPELLEPKPKNEPPDQEQT